MKIPKDAISRMGTWYSLPSWKESSRGMLIWQFQRALSLRISMAAQFCIQPIMTLRPSSVCSVCAA